MVLRGTRPLLTSLNVYFTCHCFFVVADSDRTDFSVTYCHSPDDVSFTGKNGLIFRVPGPSLTEFLPVVAIVYYMYLLTVGTSFLVGDYSKITSEYCHD